MTDAAISSDTVRMLVSSMTQNGKAPLTELEVERFLNALTRTQAGVPTGAQNPTEHIS